MSREKRLHLQRPRSAECSAPAQSALHQLLNVTSRGRPPSCVLGAPRDFNGRPRSSRTSARHT
eukprot:1447649-Prymnesium_polylepis.1